MVNGEFMPENVHGTEEDDILFLEVGVEITLGECNAIAYALIIPCSLGKFFGVNHLHFQIERAYCLAVFVCFSRKDVVTDSFVFGVITQHCLWCRGFKVVDFDAEQVLDEGLGDMRVAEYESEHNRVGNVEIVKRLNFHVSTPMRFLLGQNSTWGPIILTRFFQSTQAICAKNFTMFYTKMQIPGQARDDMQVKKAKDPPANQRVFAAGRARFELAIGLSPIRP